MTPRRRHAAARIVAVASLLVIAVVVSVMAVGYARARRAEPRDAARIAELQATVQSDASAAVRLAQEQDRVTRTRQARKRRDDALAWVLLAAAVTFVGAAKWPAARESARPRRLPLKAIRLEVAADPVGQGFSVDHPVRPEGLPHTVKEGESFTHTACPVTRASDPVGQDFSPDISNFVDHLVQQHGRGREAAIPILQAIQAHYRYLPDDALRRVCEVTDVTPAQVAGTSSFYARFRRSPVGEHVVRVCHGTACHVAGARQIADELRRHLHIVPGQDTDPSRQFTIDEVACLGCCSLAPVLMVDEHTAGRLTPATAPAALNVVSQAERV